MLPIDIYFHKRYNKKKSKEGINMISQGNEVYLIENQDIQSLFSARKRDCHKGDFGYVGIMGGSTAYSGAIKLANMSLASLRSGAGVVRVIVPQSIVSSISPYLLEQTLFPLKDENSHMTFLPDQLKQALAKLKALAVGMGWGEGKENTKILTYLLQTVNFPLVIDADGLGALAKMDKTCLLQTKARVILTPHRKEFEKMSGYSLLDINQDPIQKAKTFAKKYHVILLLKGPTTIVTDGKVVYLINRGCSGMATAGSGDVLSGILVGLLGYQEANCLTISAGAYLAGVAGELAQKEKTDIAMIASDTISHIPQAIQEIRKKI